MGSSKLARLSLAVGFLALAAGVVVAYRTPATGFEVDIYRATPVGYWIGFAVSMVVSLLFALSSAPSTRRISVGLGYLSFATLILLPLLRGWQNVLGADSMTHVGSVKYMLEGNAIPTEFLYPLFHTLSVLFSTVTSIPPGQTFHFVVSVVALLFVLSIALTVRLLTDHSWGLSIGLFAGMLLIPINHVSGHMHFQPSSQTILFLSFVFYLIARMELSRDVRDSALVYTMLPVVVMGHPQQGANLILFMLGFGVLQTAHVIYNSDASLTLEHTLGIQFAALVAIWWLWIQKAAPDRFASNFVRLISWLYEETEAVESVQSRSGSVEQIGGSLSEMFLKLFLVALLFSGIAAAVMGGSLWSIVGDRRSRLGRVLTALAPRRNTSRHVVAYWTAGFTISAGLFVYYAVAGYSDQYFRHFAFLMVSVTVIAAVGLVVVLDRLDRLLPPRAVRAVAVVGLVCLLAISLVAVYPSPYIYQDSDHVSQANLNGHEVAFEYAQEDSDFASIRMPTERYLDARLDPRPSDRKKNLNSTGSVPDHFASDPVYPIEESSYRDITNLYDERFYVTVTDINRAYEPDVIDGFRWNEGDFRYLQSEPGVNRVQDTGGFELYLVSSRHRSDSQQNA